MKVPNPTGDRPEHVSRVVLVGMMGSGKSTVGLLAAGLLGADFADSDDEVERSAGLTVKQIFETRGEASFRDAEADALHSLLGAPGPIVVAAGGGVVLREGNRELMRRDSTVVWLRAGTSELAKRIGDTDSDNDGAGRGGGDSVAGRPLLAGRQPEETLENRLGEILRERSALYESVAHFVVDTDGLPPESVAQAVASLAGVRVGEPAGNRGPSRYRGRAT
jgi:shikimate kinase